MPCRGTSHRARFHSVFDGLKQRTLNSSRSATVPVAPQSRVAVAEMAGRLQYNALRDMYQATPTNSNRTYSCADYDEQQDVIKAVDLTGSSAVDVKYKRSMKQEALSELHMSMFGNSTELSPEEKLYKINEMVLTEFEFTPFIFQKRFFRLIMQCIAQLIVGEETWNQRGAAIMKHFHWHTIGHMAVATSLRRGGKTQIVSYVLAAACLTKQLVAGFFGRGQRASDGARHTFLKAIERSKYSDSLPTLGFGKESLPIRTVYDRPGAISIVSFYPANETIRLSTSLLLCTTHPPIHTPTHHATAPCPIRMSLSCSVVPCAVIQK